MKLYINKNCSGFRWFECVLGGDDKYIKMEESKSLQENTKIIGGLRSYGQYDYCLAKENNLYILSLNNIPERGLDTYGRSITMKLIFVTEGHDDLELLEKILFTRIEDFDEFSKRIDACFASSVLSTPIYVRCDWEKLKNYFEEISSKTLSQTITAQLKKTMSGLMIVSPDSYTAMKEIGFSKGEYEKACNVLKGCNSSEYFISSHNSEEDKVAINSNENATNQLQDLRSRIESKDREITILQNSVAEKDKAIQTLNETIKNLHQSGQLNTNDITAVLINNKKLKYAALSMGAVAVVFLVMYLTK